MDTKIYTTREDHSEALKKYACILKCVAGTIGYFTPENREVCYVVLNAPSKCVGMVSVKTQKEYDNLLT